ncbi:MAG: hypothetical protein ACT4PM_00125 [Gemmatimonadales bacterium]
MRRRDHVLLLAAALAMLAVAGCGSQRAEAGLSPQQQEDSTIVVVQNDNITNMRIWVVRVPAGGEYPLGLARGSNETRFRVPRSLVTGVSEVTFRIAPQGGGRAVYSQTITISPGDEIVLRIPP